MNIPEKSAVTLMAIFSVPIEIPKSDCTAGTIACAKSQNVMTPKTMPVIIRSVPL